MERAPVAVGPGIRFNDERFELRTVEAPNLRLELVVLVDPPRDERDAKKWILPAKGKGKEDQVTVRNAVLDGVLHLLRTLRDTATRVRGVVTYVESCFVAAAAGRSQLREEVYAKRRCSAAERAELDEVVKSWECMVLVDPGGFPPRVLKSHVDDALPELETMYFGRSMQVVPVMSKQSLTMVEAKELRRWCRGEVLRVEVDVPHPSGWNPPWAIRLDVPLQVTRGVDDLEEVADYGHVTHMKISS